MVKCFRGASSLLFSTANKINIKALSFSYLNLRKKIRDFRRLWITRVNAAVRRHAMSYSEFMYYLKKSSIKLNRKVTAQLSIFDPAIFTQLLLF